MAMKPIVGELTPIAMVSVTGYQQLNNVLISRP